MRKVSDKRKKELEKYSGLRKSFLTRNRGCQALKKSGSKCPRLATEVHHRKGRGKYLNVVASWMAVCPRCHRVIEEERSWARAMGYLLNRLSPRAIPPLKT